MGESFYKKMETGELFFWNKHGKLANLQILAPKIFPDFEASHIWSHWRVLRYSNLSYITP